MAYFEMMVAAVPTTARDAYAEHARSMMRIFRDHGALRCVELWGDDVPHGTLTDYYRAVQARPDETVVAGWIEWPDRATRDAGVTAVNADPRMQAAFGAMPFDGRRMIYGGFAPLVEA